MIACKSENVELHSNVLKIAQCPNPFISRHSKSIYHAFMMHDIRFSDAHNMQSTGTGLHVAMNLIVKLYTYQCSRHLYTV